MFSSVRPHRWTALAGGLFLLLVSVIPVATAQDAAATTTGSLPDQSCSPNPVFPDLIYCWDVRAAQPRGSMAVSGHVGGNGRVTVTIAPNMSPCAHYAETNCLWGVIWNATDGSLQHQYEFFCPTREPESTAEFHQCEPRARTGTDRIEPEAVPGQCASGRFNTTYVPGGPPGATWADVASSLYTCTFQMPDDAELVNLDGETWYLGHVLLEVNCPPGSTYQTGCANHTTIDTTGPNAGNPGPENWINFAIPVQGEMHPTPRFDANVNGFDVNLVDRSFFEPNHSVTYAWDFGDGNYSNAIAPSHTYAAAGTYPVTLRLTDNTVNTTYEPARTRMLTQYVTIVNDDTPDASFTSAKGSTPGTYTFTATSTDPNDLALTHEWDFGDGQSATGATVTHTFTDPGARSVTLTSTNTDGLADSTTSSVQVDAPQLTVTATASETNLQVGDEFDLKVKVAASADGVGDLSGVEMTSPLNVGTKVEVVTPGQLGMAAPQPGPAPLGPGGVIVDPPDGPPPFDLAPGTSRTVTWRLRAKSAGSATITSSWRAQDASGSSVGPEQASATVTIGRADLGVELTVTPDKAAPGQEMKAKITITNPTSAAIDNVTPKLDHEWTPTEPGGPDVTIGAFTPPSMATLAPHASVSFEAILKAPRPGSLKLTATAKGKDAGGEDVTSQGVDKTVPIEASLIVNSTGDGVDDDTSDEACNTGDTVEVDGEQVAECTLRAALEQAAASGEGEISFDIPGGSTPTIAPSSELPDVGASIVIDGTSQRGGWVNLDGTDAGDIDGLSLTADGSTVKGLVITGFGEAGIRLAGSGAHTVTGNRIGVGLDETPAANGHGVVVDDGSTANTIGGAGADANVIAFNGADGQSAPALPESTTGTGSIESALSNLSANVEIAGSGSATVRGNHISGVAGVILSGSGDGSSITGNVIEANLGVGAGATAPGSGGVAITSNTFRAAPNGQDAIGVFVVGAGISVTSNSFDGVAMPVVASTIAASASLRITDNTVAGATMGVLLAKTSGARVSDNTIGAQLGVVTYGDGTNSSGNNTISGNHFDGTVGVAISGQSDDVVSDNSMAAGKIGVMIVAGADTQITANTLATDVGVWTSGPGTPAFGRNRIASNDLSGQIGVVVAGDDADEIRDNTVNTSKMGIVVSTSQASTVASNTITGGLVGLYLANVGGSQITGNTVTGATYGALAVASEPDDAPAIGTTPADPSTDLNAAATGLAVDLAKGWMNDTQSIVEFDPTTIFRSAVSGALNRWHDNSFTGNDVGLLLAGATNANEVGSLGSPNTITGNRFGGIVLGGTTTPQDVTIRGNVLFGNGAVSPVAGGTPDIKLLPAGDTLPDSAWGPLANDPGDGDVGANALVNHPILTTIAADGSVVNGDLWSTPSTSFIVDIYATNACSATGYGGANRHVTSVNVTTNAQGFATFSVPAGLAAGESATATATTTGAFADGATSEFSRCAARGQIGTTTSAAAAVGDSRVEVASNANAVIGDTVTINPGEANADQVVITGFGSFILDRTLSQAHQLGELVLITPAVPVDPTPNPNPDPDPTPTPTPHPTPTPGLNPVQASVAKSNWSGSGEAGRVVQADGLLPATGSDPLRLVMIGLGLVLVGSALVRRRGRPVGKHA